MIWWILAGISVLIIFIIWILIRADWSEMSNSDSGWMDKLKKFGDACCLGNIFRKK